MRILKVFGLAMVLVTCPTAVGQQRADLTGAWTNASLTTLNRPAGVDRLILIKAEADALVAKINIAGFAPEGAPTEDFSDPEAGAPTRGSADFGVKAYDQFWVAPGERLALVKGNSGPPTLLIRRMVACRCAQNTQGSGRPLPVT